MKLRLSAKSVRESVRRLGSRSGVSIALVFLLFLAAFAWAYLPLSSVSTSDDHFFHIRLAEDMRERGVLGSFRNFDSLPFSKAAEGEGYFLYYNFLFYLILIPFSYASPLIFGSKLYSVFAAAAFFTALYAAIRALSVRYAFLATAALFSLMHIDSLWRLFASRPFVLAPALLALFLAALFARRPAWAFSIAFLYPFWHSATFFMPMVVAGAYAAFEKLHAGRADARVLLAGCAGTVLSFASICLIAPGFVTYTREIVFASALAVGDIPLLAQGIELYPMDAFAFAKQHLVLLSVAITGIAFECFLYARRRGASAAHQDRHAAVRATLLALAFAFFSAAVFITSRFADYLFVFFALYAALAFERLKREVSLADSGIRRALALGAVGSIAYLSVVQIVSLREMLGSGPAPELFQGAGAWLSENAPEGAIVFNPTWNWFPQLYYWNPRGRYVIGLEPRFLYDYDERLYWLWFYVGNRGYVCGERECQDKQAAFMRAAETDEGRNAWARSHEKEVASVIIDEFGASFVVSSPEFPVLNDVLDASSRFRKVYGEGKAHAVYQAID